MKKIYADLHSHTTHSDGKLSPKDLIAKAKSKGLSVLTITDHDTISAYEYVNGDIHLMIGVELTCYFDKREIHLLAYNFDPSDKVLNQYFTDIREQREIRAKNIIKQLQTRDVQITYDDLKKRFPLAILTRSHIAQVLSELDIVKHPWHAFKSLIADEHLNLPKVNFFTVEDAIKNIKKAGGFTSLAHPGKYYSDMQLYSLIKWGMKCIEVKHPSHNESTEKRLLNFVKQYSINFSAGSDYHGRNEDEEKFIGNFGLTEEQFEKLRRKFKINFLTS